MREAIPLALGAGVLTATSSVCQRRAASRFASDGGFSPGLVLHLASQPVWLAGIVSMILGFVGQAAALHFGSLALVQPILASELLWVFAYMAVASPTRVRPGDWLAAAAIAAGLGVFLLTADPSGGRTYAPPGLWLLAGLTGFGVVALVSLAAFAPLRRGQRPSPGRQAALLGVATGVSWGFLAAVIKQLSENVASGLVGILSTWSPYALVVLGSASMVLASNALRAGPLAASQPGFTIADPVVATLLGLMVFGDHLNASPIDLAVEAVALAILVAGVMALSHSSLVHGEPDPGGAQVPAKAPREGG